MRHIIFSIAVFFTLLPLPLFSQDSDLLSKEFHAGRRQAFRELMPEKSAAVFFANPVRNRNNDVDFQYAQNSDFYYLTGYTEPHSMIIIFKEETAAGADKVKSNEIIFVQDRDLQAEIWNGKRLGKEGVNQKLGFANVYLNKDFKDFEIDFTQFERVLVYFPEGIKNERGTTADLYDLVEQFKSKAAADKYDIVRIRKYMAQLREIKLPEEIALMQKAIDMSCLAQIELMKALEPGMTEYQAQAIIEYMFKSNGSEYTGYPSIVGGGENSCVLHYITNRKKLRANDMLLTDAGAEYHGYTADVTRTMPVDSKFSPEEREIYNLVLKSQLAGIEACKPGNSFQSTDEAARKVIAEGLVQLGIIKEEDEARRYFMHGTSHYLGLDVHDAGTYGALKPGVVITVEPGVYIPSGSPCDRKWWDIGVRIEDDVLITAEGHRVMSDKAPKTIEEIERIMQEKSFFNELMPPLGD